MSDTEDKRAFALAWLRQPDDAFKAACEIWPNDTQKALKASSFWVRDPEVIAERERLLDEHGEEAFLPSKHDLAREIWKLTQDGLREDRIKAMKLYAEVRGFIEKPQTNVNVDNSKTTHNVMLVAMPASIEEWQQKAVAQQKQLVSNARPTH